MEEALLAIVGLFIAFIIANLEHERVRRARATARAKMTEAWELDGIA